ncbi:hypothetical protein EPK99_23700 [Neorhizobium lilium]|uniref:Uncharacterized protein n=1 Tax=Neorhizobium lilium TaxID=2503024 RepID=A0A3S3VHU5_9HYPH|nr:hypothetical protein EPK99_23700 [Neorhizobium lilium]
MEKAAEDDRNSPVGALQDEILKRTKLHTEMVRRLVHDPNVQPLQLAGFLEDIANAYLSISEELSQVVTQKEKRSS